MKDEKIEYIKFCWNGGYAKTDFWVDGENYYLEKSIGYPLETPIGVVAIEKDGLYWKATHVASGLLVSRQSPERRKTKEDIIKYCKSLSLDMLSPEEKQKLEKYSKLLEENKEKAR